MLHAIKKQVVQIQITDRKEAFFIQQEFHHFFWTGIIPQLEKIFDSLSIEGEVLEIDKLELDLGQLKRSQLRSNDTLRDLYPKMLAEIREKIQDHVLRKGKDESNSSIIMQWLFYMEKGYLNWNTFVPGATWYQQVIEGLAINYKGISLLRKLVRSDKNALKRISSSHEDAFLLHLAEVLSAQKQGVLQQFILELEKILSIASFQKRSFGSTDKKILKQKVWAKIIETTAEQKGEQKSELLVSHIMDWLVPDDSLNQWIQVCKRAGAPAFHKALLEKIKSSGLINRKEADDSRVRTESDIKQKKEALSNSEKPANKEALNGIKENKDKDDLSETTVRKQLESKIKEEREPISEADKDPGIDEIFAVHAGLILFHPFLSSFFSRLSLTGEGLFVDEAAKIKAIYILHYLATGREQIEEFELVIPKFLVGYPVQKLIPLPLILRSEEKEEAEALLDAVITNWKIIGNTSRSGLQESFLQRKGKLYTKAEKLYLHLETSSIDVLLDHLPWNLSIIKLPWMKELLRVEWR